MLEKSCCSTNNEINTDGPSFATGAPDLSQLDPWLVRLLALQRVQQLLSPSTPHTQVSSRVEHSSPHASPLQRTSQDTTTSISNENGEKHHHSPTHSKGNHRQSLWLSFMSLLSRNVFEVA